MITMRFYTEPIGFLNIDYLLERAGTRWGGMADLLWPAGLWERIVEDADMHGISPEQLVLRIVREHYGQGVERDGVYRDDE